MRRILVVALLLAATGGAFADVTRTAASGKATALVSATFANLGTPINGNVRYCSDCAATSPCTGSGSGAFAFRSGSAWNCNTGSGGTTLPVDDGTAVVKGSGDATKLVRIEADGLATGQTRVITMPDSNTILPIFAQILTFNGPTAARTFTLPDASDTVATIAASQTLTNKTLTTPSIAAITNGGTITVPSGTDTLVARTTTDTLTNKTLTTPTISSITNGGTVTIPSGTDTLVARTSTDTLTNKTIAESEITNLTTDLAAKQALDATLTALAAYNTNGLLAQTAADTFAGRTITSGSARLSTTNGNGVSGNPTLDVVQAPFEYAEIADATAIANTLTETAFSKSRTLSAGYINAAGTVITVRASGVYSTTSNPSMTMHLRVGGTTILAFVFTTGTSVTGFGWEFEGQFVVRTTGASASMFPNGGIGYTIGGGFQAGSGTSAVTKDLTASQAVDVTVTWGAASASNTVTMQALTISVGLAQNNS